MDRCAQATCTTGHLGWMITALESVKTQQNATCSPMGSPSLKATTGDTRATSMSGIRWVRHSGLVHMCRTT